MSRLFATIVKHLILLGKYMQQATQADGIRFVGTFRANLLVLQLYNFYLT